ncbi:putative nitroreductase TM1586 domain-containing protein [Entamoeba marina]
MSNQPLGLSNQIISKLNRIVLNRQSTRSYSNELLTNDQCEQLDEFIKYLNATRTPFNAQCRFCLMRKDINKISTFGVITGKKYWIYGVIEKKNEAAERQFGYLFEHLILKCTEMGLSTAWLSGSIKTTSFDQLKYDNDNEYIPSASPVGFDGRGKELIGKMMKSKKRKEWSNNFFYKDKKTPLTEEHLKKSILDKSFFEHLRWAPTSSNSQKGRIVINDNLIHFFIKKSIHTQIDGGIYVAHAEIYFKAHDINFEIVPFDNAEHFLKEYKWNYLLSYKINI